MWAVQEKEIIDKLLFISFVVFFCILFSSVFFCETQRMTKAFVGSDSIVSLRKYSTNDALDGCLLKEGLYTHVL